MDKLIKEMGNKFRGLWKLRPLGNGGMLHKHEWFVTFIYRGDVVDTDGYNNPELALKTAISTLYYETKE